MCHHVCPEAPPSQLGWTSTHPSSTEATWESQGQGSHAYVSQGLIGEVSWEPARGVPTRLEPRRMCPCGGHPPRDVPAEPVCTHAAQAAAPRTEQSPRRGSTSTLDHGATAPLRPLPSAIAFQPSGWLILSWREGRCSPTCRQDSLQESVGLSPLGMSRDLGSHRDPSRQPLAQRQPQPSLPFLPSKRSRQFSLPKYTTWACRCKKRLQALGMNFTKKACFWETDKFGGVLLSSAATAQYIPLLNVQCAGSS